MGCCNPDYRKIVDEEEQRVKREMKILLGYSN